MKAAALEYGKECRHIGMSDNNKFTFLGQEGNKYWFRSFVKTEDGTVSTGMSWMVESQIETLLEEI